MINRTIPLIINTFDNDGDLYINDIYNMYEDQPIIFTCINNKSIYIGLCYEFRGKIKYILNKVTIDEINKLLNKEITIYDIFTVNHMFNNYKLLAIQSYCDMSADICYLTTFDNIKEVLPPKDLYLKRDVFEKDIIKCSICGKEMLNNINNDNICYECKEKYNKYGYE